jgi:HSP20 family protein
MAITRFTYRAPWSELDQLTSRLGHFFNDEMAGAGNGSWVPAVNVEENQDELLLTAEIPGMSREQIQIEVENHVLTIRGEKAIERSEDGEGTKYHVWERRHGSFARSFTLPRTVRSEDIAADYRDGVLTIRMPKAPEAKSRKIEIGVGEGAAQLG